MSRGSIHEVPYSAPRPRRVNDVDMRAPRAANRRSQYNAWISPMPAHAPLIAAIIGFGMLSA